MGADAFPWLTFSVALFYVPSHKVCSAPPDIIVDFGCKNLQRLSRMFPGCNLVVYYNTSTPEQFLKEMLKLGAVLVFCDSPDPRAPCFGRVAELDVRRSKWTVLFDMQDDVRTKSVRAGLRKVRELASDGRSILATKWTATNSNWREEDRLRFERELPGVREYFDAAGLAVSESAPSLGAQRLIREMGRPYEYGDDEIIIARSLAAIDPTLVDHGVSFGEVASFDLSGVRILDKTAPEHPSRYGHEVWPPSPPG